jgi:alanine-glyoxylate transaminase/serine-glyoxylate transaminase/serine-pyruvate transaminase
VTTNSSIHPPQRLLFGPGPTQVAPSVYTAMSQTIVSHLDPYFFQVSEGIQEMLRAVFGTSNKLTFAISGTGSGGMETAISSLVEQGTKVCVFANGFFCDRMTEMAKRQGGDVVRLEKPWGEVFTDAEAKVFIDREKPQVVMFVQAETSTGAFQQGTGICKAAHDAGALVIGDVVTSLGAMPVKVDETGIDIAYSCTQKGLSCVPGLSPITVSPRAAEYIEARKTQNRSWYFDLKLLNDYYKVSHRYHHTASATLFYGLHEALSLIKQEGVEQRWARHRQMHQEFVKGVEKLGMRMHVPAEHRIVNLNTPVVPEGVDEAKVRKILLDEHGIEIMGGFGPLAGKVFRIGVMGPLATSEHVEKFLSVFADALERSRSTANVI